MSNFRSTMMYKKGQVGERILDELIARRDKFVPYAPVFDGSHAFDRLLVSRDKRQLQILEVKTIDARNSKPEWRMTGYPDTGISIAHYHEYLHIQETYCLDVFIAFVDASAQEIYGGTLNALATPSTIRHMNKDIHYPLIADNFTAVGGKIIYFPLAHMTRNLYALTDEQCAELKQYDNHGYKQDVTHKRGYSQWKNNHK